MPTLNRNNSNWSFEERRKINENWEILEREANSSASNNNGLKQEIDELKNRANDDRNNLNTAKQNSAQALIASRSSLDVANRAETKANSVQRQFDDIVSNSDSNPEVIQARGGRRTLRARLDEESEFVRNTISEIDRTKTSIEQVRENTNIRPIDVSEFNTQTRELLTGGSVAVVGVNSVGNENIKRQSVNETKVSFLTNSGNIFNKNDLINGGYYNSTGAFEVNAQFTSSNFIEIEYANTYITNISSRIYSHVVFFDINKVFVDAIRAGEWSGTINVPNNPNIYYMTFSFFATENLDTLVLVRGNQLPANYIPYNFKLSEDIVLPASLTDGLVSKDEIKVSPGKNLFNYETMVLLGREMGANAVERAANNSALLDFLEVDPSFGSIFISGLTPYNLGFERAYSFFDENRNPLLSNISNQFIRKTSTGQAINIPSNAKYFRINIYSNKTSPEVIDFSTIQIEYGLNQTSFEPYRASIRSINGYSLDKNEVMKTNNLNLLLFGDSITETATLSDDGSNYTEGTRENWPLYTQRALSFRQLWNYAKAGASYKNRDIGTGSNTITNVRQRVTHQVQTAINNNRPGDIIIFAAGTNDGNTNMGTYESALAKPTLQDLDQTLLYESLRWCFWTIQTNYPNALKFVSLPIQRFSYEPVESLANAITRMAKRYGFIVIDMNNESQIIREFENDGPGRDLYDGLHPNSSGQMKMAKVFNRHILNGINDGI